MGAGPMTNPSKKERPTWKLAPPHDALTQGIVVSGFNSLPSALALFLECNSTQRTNGAEAENWLQALKRAAPITDADGRDERAASIAFTWTGLQQLGLSADALATFSAPFREGMHQEDRLRRLGDKVNDAWQATVIDGGPLWSANIPARKEDTTHVSLSPLGNVGGAPEGDERQVTTPNTVHGLLLLYDKDEAAVKAWATTVEEALAAQNVKIVYRLLLDLRLDENNIGREHFGFADGLSQPIPYASDPVVLIDGKPAVRDQWHGVPLGDVLLGHNDAHNEKAPGPVVVDDQEGKARASGLAAEGAPVGFLNLGLMAATW